MRRLLAACLALMTVSLAARGDSPKVKTGLDVWKARDFAPLHGKKVGLLVNHTARTTEGALLVDLLIERKDITLVRIFSPEHGLEGKKDEFIKSGSYREIPVVSLYGERKKPTVDELRGLDVLVYDIQDVGTRYYTYLASLAMTMEVAKESGVKVVVLDRPDPSGGVVLEGPIADAALRKKFTSYSALPTRYGLTIGEYARWVNEIEKLGAELEVVKMDGWRRGDQWEDTGLPWRNPSPNLRSSEAALLYTGLGILEKTNLSVGRGTDTPFLVYGGPFVDGVAWTKALGERKLEGIEFEATEFLPTASTQAKKKCQGVRVRVTDRKKIRTVTVALHMIDTLRALSKDFHFVDCGGMLGDRDALEQLTSGKTIDDLLDGFAKGRAEFEKLRNKVLLYR